MYFAKPYVVKQADKWRCYFLSMILVIAFNATCFSQAKPGKDFLTGKFDYRKDTSFMRVPVQYTAKEVYLQKATFYAFVKMRNAALKDGVKLVILSGTRSFYDQKYKWDNKWSAPEFSGIKDESEKVSRLLRWWSMPGTSRHHWGTDMDITNMQLSYYRTPAGIKMYNWMVKHAAAYGFYQPFSPNRTSGYQEEKWHWSYAPLSKYYLSEYVKQVGYQDIRGFSGSTSAKKLDTITNWVLAVNPMVK